jgi:hypothetical protein
MSDKYLDNESRNFLKRKILRKKNLISKNKGKEFDGVKFKEKLMAEIQNEFLK